MIVFRKIVFRRKKNFAEVIGKLIKMHTYL